MNFDGITYAKGASRAHSWWPGSGETEFLAGLRSYFATHAWGNTSWPTCSPSSRRPSGRDLPTGRSRGSRPPALHPAARARRWTTDVDHRSPSAGGRRRRHPTLRRTASAIGALRPTDGGLVRTPPVRGRRRRRARTRVPELVGRRRPDLLLLNDDDLTFAKIRLDERSMATAARHIGRLRARSPGPGVVAAWDMTRDAELGARAFVTGARQHRPARRPQRRADPVAPAGIDTDVLPGPAAPDRASRDRRGSAVGPLDSRHPAATVSSSSPGPSPGTPEPRTCSPQSRPCWRVVGGARVSRSTPSCGGDFSWHWSPPEQPASRDHRRTRPGRHRVGQAERGLGPGGGTHPLGEGGGLAAGWSTRRTFPTPSRRPRSAGSAG